MSDSIEELSKAYRRNVSEEHPRSVGLFPIPEYTEYEVSGGMWSSAVDVLLTTLRYLAPATLLTLFWGQQSFFFKLLKYIDSAFRSLVCTSEEQREVVLQWLEAAGPVRVTKLETVWRHGWIVCGVLDIALPGTCAGHPPTKLSLKHAQSIAEDYLGVEPVFTRQELECIETLGKHQEWKLITLLDNIRLATAKLTPRPTRTSPIRFAAESNHHTFDYIAKGSGLVAAQIKHKAFFKLYPTAQQSLNPAEINVEIKGAKKSHGTCTIPPILGKAQMIRQSLLGRKATSHYTENILPITQGTTYLRNFGKNDMSKTYFIPKIKNNIQIETETHEDHVKVSYTVALEGTYEITITSKNLSIAGSPFSMKASKNIVETLENDNFSLEDGEEIDIVDISTDKKAILRIVDFGTEKMLLKENGCLEKISVEEAKKLMTYDNSSNEGPIIEDNKCTSHKSDSKYFYEAARKVMLMNRVCKYFWSYNIKPRNVKQAEILIINQGIPDVVNSTLNDYNVNANLISEKRDKYIIPEKISVSILTEKHTNTDDKNMDTKKTDDLTNYGPIYDNIFDSDISLDTPNTSNNPFDESYLQNYSTEKKYGSFIMTEYETNNSQSEETQNTTMKTVNEEDKNCEQSTNPFTVKLESELKTTESNKGPLNPFTGDSLGNDITSPDRVIDFKIGAPVSLPVNLLTTSTESLNSQKSNTSSDTASCDKSEKENDSSQECKHKPTTKKSSEMKHISPKKEMWDSAYVSIDENNTSDILSNENIDEVNLLKSQRNSNISIDNNILEKFDTIQEKTNNENDSKKMKTETNTLSFTSIQEENDRNETAVLNINNPFDSKSENETDSVTEAFAELDDIYDDYFTDNVEESNTINRNTEIVCVEIHQAPKYDVRVDSASDKSADVKRPTTAIEGKTSEIQFNVTESVSASQILPEKGTDIEENNITKNFDETQFGDKIYANIVIEKKHYWDEKIRQIQAKEEELKNLNKRRLSSKYLRRNDSLTKRRGKQIVKNILKSKEKEIESDNSPDLLVQKSAGASYDSSHNKARLKDSLRNYWDSRVQAIPSMDSCFGKKTEKDKEKSRSKDDTAHIVIVTKTQEDTNLYKQDLSDQVFEAFETSPKRFFGTSRKHILNKIDTFLGKSEHDNENKIDFTSEIKHDSGLVSSRISLFHNITKTEPLPTSYRKHKSLNNIYTEKVSIDKNFILKEHPKSFDCGNNSTSNKIGNVVNIDKNANLIQEPLVSFQVKKLEDNDNLKNEAVNTSDKINDRVNIDVRKDLEVAIDSENDNDHFEERDQISIQNFNDYGNSNTYSFKDNKLKSFSKSEMDIFSKTSTAIDIDFDKHQSYENLPTISVKKFVSLYEFVSKSSDQPKSMESNRKSKKFRGKISNESSTEGTAKETKIDNSPPREGAHNTETKSKILENNNNFESSTIGSASLELISNEDKHRSCLSLSDVEIEIIENTDDANESGDRFEPESYRDYKNRFKMAKQYFKSLEELRIEKKPKEYKDHVVSVADIPEESLEPTEKKKKMKRGIKKSHSMPSSELSKIWSQMQEETNDNPKKLMKISEKFNVEDLYEDVMDGRLSRQGSLRGIPNKKAVLETFRSMENVNAKSFNSYELATSHIADFENENKVRNVQSYLSEYPYLPTTEPSKYHSRFDASAFGLITFKELKEIKEKRTFRRNSVPNARINPIFTEEI